MFYAITHIIMGDIIIDFTKKVLKIISHYKFIRV